jgi:hypothetical protein
MQLQYLMKIENVLGKAPSSFAISLIVSVCDVIPIVFTFLLQVPEQKLQVERDYTGTKHIPIFVMLPVSTVYTHSFNLVVLGEKEMEHVRVNLRL